MQIIYCHMIYSPETDKQIWQQIHGTWWLDNIGSIHTNGQRTLSNPHSVHETDKQIWQQIHGTWWLDNIGSVHTNGQRTLSNPHSVHDGSSLSGLTLLPVFFLIHGAVDSFPAGGWLLILLPAWGAGLSLIPPTRVAPIYLRFQAASHSSVGYSYALFF